MISGKGGTLAAGTLSTQDIPDGIDGQSLAYYKTSADFNPVIPYAGGPVEIPEVFTVESVYDSDVKLSLVKDVDFRIREVYAGSIDEWGDVNRGERIEPLDGMEGEISFDLQSAGTYILSVEGIGDYNGFGELWFTTAEGIDIATLKPFTDAPDFGEVPAGEGRVINLPLGLRYITFDENGKEVYQDLHPEYYAYQLVESDSSFVRADTAQPGQRALRIYGRNGYIGSATLPVTVYDPKDLSHAFAQFTIAYQYLHQGRDPESVSVDVRSAPGWDDIALNEGVDFTIAYENVQTKERTDTLPTAVGTYRAYIEAVPGNKDGYYGSTVTPGDYTVYQAADLSKWTVVSDLDRAAGYSIFYSNSSIEDAQWTILALDQNGDVQSLELARWNVTCRIEDASGNDMGSSITTPGDYTLVIEALKLSDYDGTLRVPLRLHDSAEGTGLPERDLAKRTGMSVSLSDWMAYASPDLTATDLVDSVWVDGAGRLVAGRDYTVEAVVKPGEDALADLSQPGACWLRITGIGGYYGSVYREITIQRSRETSLQFAGLNVWASPADTNNIAYTGKPIAIAIQQVRAWDSENGTWTNLTEGVDYEFIGIRDNQTGEMIDELVDYGKYSAVLEGRGDYWGQFYVPVRVVEPYNLEYANMLSRGAVYSEGATRNPVTEVRFMHDQLVANKDYELVFYDLNGEQLSETPSEPGVYQVGARGISPYFGEQRISYRVFEGAPYVNLIHENVYFNGEPAQWDYWYTSPDEWRMPAVTVSYDGVSLEKDKDFRVELRYRGPIDDQNEDRLVEAVTEEGAYEIRLYDLREDRREDSLTAAWIYIQDNRQDLSKLSAVDTNLKTLYTGKTALPRRIWVQDQQGNRFFLLPSNEDLKVASCTRDGVEAEPIEQGTYTCTLVGPEDSYRGKFTFDFTIVAGKLDLDSDYLGWSGFGTTLIYTGQPVTPIREDVNFYYEGERFTLTPADYDVVYYQRDEDTGRWNFDAPLTQLVEKGTYWMRLTGKGDYVNSFSLTIDVYDKKDLRIARIFMRDLVRMPDANKDPIVRVLDYYDDEMTRGVDYQVQYYRLNEDDSQTLLSELPSEPGRYQVGISNMAPENSQDYQARWFEYEIIEGVDVSKWQVLDSLDVIVGADSHGMGWDSSEPHFGWTISLRTTDGDIKSLELDSEVSLHYAKSDGTPVEEITEPGDYRVTLSFDEGVYAGALDVDFTAYAPDSIFDLGVLKDFNLLDVTVPNIVLDGAVSVAELSVDVMRYWHGNEFWGGAALTPGVEYEASLVRSPDDGEVALDVITEPGTYYLKIAGLGEYTGVVYQPFTARSSEGLVAVHVIVSPVGDPLYTADMTEVAAKASEGWQDWGVAFWASAQAGEGSQAVYRLHNPNASRGAYHYTSDVGEYGDHVSLGWEGQGVAFTLPDAASIPIYRIYDPNSGVHFYTTSYSDRNSLLAAGWHFEGVSWYAEALGSAKLPDFSSLYDLANATVEAQADVYLGDPYSLAPIESVRLGSIKLSESRYYGYQVSYYADDDGALGEPISGVPATTNGADSARFIAVITGMGNYHGSQQVSYTLHQGVGPKVSLADVTVASIPEQLAMGREVTPKLGVTYRGLVLAEGVDYTVSYRDNVRPGEATAILTAVEDGRFTGTREVRFTLVGANDLSRAWFNVPPAIYAGDDVAAACKIELDDGVASAEGYVLSFYCSGNPDNLSDPVEGAPSEPGRYVVVARGLADAGSDAGYHGSCSAVFDIVEKPKTEGLVAVHLIESPTGTVLYLVEGDELNAKTGAGWADCGVAFWQPEQASADTQEVYRVYNANVDEYHFTTDAMEARALVAAGWRDEGVAFNEPKSRDVPVFRLYNPNAYANNHFYTTNPLTRDELMMRGYSDESIPWYAAALGNASVPGSVIDTRNLKYAKIEVKSTVSLFEGDSPNPITRVGTLYNWSLAEGRDYTVSFYIQNEDGSLGEQLAGAPTSIGPAESGRYVAVVAGIGSYHGIRQFPYELKIADVSTWTMLDSLDLTEGFSANGKPWDAAAPHDGWRVALRDDDGWVRILTMGTDIDVTYRTAAGEPAEPATAGDYVARLEFVRTGMTGSLDVPFTISGETVSLVNLNEYGKLRVEIPLTQLQGKPLTADAVNTAVVRTDGAREVVLERGTDYTVSLMTDYYAEPLASITKEGSYLVQITGRGDYSGSMHQWFSVSDARNLTRGSIRGKTAVYAGSADMNPVKEVLLGGEVVPESDYTLEFYQADSYGDLTAPVNGVPTEPGNYLVLARGKGTSSVGYHGFCSVRYEVLAAPDTEGLVAVRLLESPAGKVLYTADEAEVAAKTSDGWADLGVAFWEPAQAGEDTIDFYRLYGESGEFFYTSNEAERDSLVSYGWENQGVAFHALSWEEGVPVFRLYNWFGGTNMHFYTSSEKTRDSMIDGSLGGLSGRSRWSLEGISWYAVAPGDALIPEVIVDYGDLARAEVEAKSVVTPAEGDSPNPIGSVRLGYSWLASGRDYVVSYYAENADGSRGEQLPGVPTTAGSAKSTRFIAVITGIGDYYGTREFSYELVMADVSGWTMLDSLDLTEGLSVAGEPWDAVAPHDGWLVALRDGDGWMRFYTLGKDVAVTYRTEEGEPVSALSAGEYVAQLEFVRAGLSGVMEVPFTVHESVVNLVNLNERGALSVEVPEARLQGEPLTADATETTVTWVDPDGDREVVLERGTDYTVSLMTDYYAEPLASITKEGSYLVQITGRGDYSGSMHQWFSVSDARNLTRGSIRGKTAVYAGSADMNPVEEVLIDGEVVPADAYTVEFYQADSYGDLTAPVSGVPTEPGRYLVLVRGSGGAAGASNAGYHGVCSVRYEVVATPDAEGLVAIHQLVNYASGRVQYVRADAADLNDKVAAGWEDAGVAFWQPAQAGSGVQAVYGVHDPNDDWYYYTASAGERESLRSRGWVYDGIAFYAPTSADATPVYWLNGQSSPIDGVRYLTTSAVERDRMDAQWWWTDCGIMFYAAAPGAGVSIGAGDFQDLAHASVSGRAVVVLDEGDSPEPITSVVATGRRLVANRDYTVSYYADANGVPGERLSSAPTSSGAEEPARFHAVVTGVGGYHGSQDFVYMLRAPEPEPVDLAEAGVAEIPDQVYTGEPITPAVSLSYGGVALVEGVDYAVRYADNVAPGEALAIASALPGAYAGTREVRFNIVSADTAALQKALDAAEAAIEGVVASEDGADVTAGARWASPAQLGAVSDALAVARVLLAASAVTETQAADAERALDSAVAGLVVNVKDALVTFVSQDVTYASTNVAVGQVVEAPEADPERVGYTFGGWTLEGEAYDFSAPVTGDIRLVAAWEAVTYEVTLDLGSAIGATLGEGVPAALAYTVESDSFALPRPSAPGYEFLGWEGGGLESRTAEVVVKSGSTGNRAYVASWTKESYKLVLDLGDAGGEATFGTQDVRSSYTVEDRYELPAPYSEHYDFAGWVGIGLDEATTQVTLERATGDRSYRATWRAKWYMVTFNDSDGKRLWRAEYQYGTEFKPQAPPEKESAGGYDYVNPVWSPALSTEGLARVTGAATYTAMYTKVAHTYAIAYENVTGLANDNKTSYKIDDASDVVLLAPGAREGYEFAGWFDNAKLVGNPIAVVLRNTGDDVTLYAKWVPVSFGIAYSLNGGAIAGERKADYTVEDDSIALPTPTKAGYRFDGWFDNAEFSGEAIESIPQGSTGSRIFYAKWTPQLISAVVADQVYTGSQITPSTVVVIGPNGLVVPPEAYVLAYGENVRGSGTVSVQAKADGGFTGELTGIAFNILQPDKSTLESAISAASLKAASTEVRADSDAAKNLAPGKYWAPVEVMTAYAAAIQAAQEVAGRDANEQEVAQATRDLAAAGDVFTSARKVAVTDKDLLVTGVQDAEGDLAAVEVSADGVGLAKSQQWVSASEKAALDAAIRVARAVVSDASATQNEVDAALEALNAAFNELRTQPKWGTPVWTVTFNSNGGSPVESAQVIDGHAATRPTDPVRSGYERPTWLTLAGEEFDFASPIASDITLVAKWEQTEYTISYSGEMPVGLKLKDGASLPAEKKYRIEDSDDYVLKTTAELFDETNGIFELNPSDKRAQEGCTYVYAGLWYRELINGEQVEMRAPAIIPAGSIGDYEFYAKTKKIELEEDAQKTSDKDARTQVSAESADENTNAFAVDGADRALGREVVLEVEKQAEVSEDASAAEQEAAAGAIKDAAKSAVEALEDGDVTYAEGADSNKSVDDILNETKPAAQFNVDLEVQEPTGETVRTVSEAEQIGNLRLEFPMGPSYAGRWITVLQIHKGKGAAGNYDPTWGQGPGRDSAFVYFLKADARGHIFFNVRQLSEFYLMADSADKAKLETAIASAEKLLADETITTGVSADTVDKGVKFVTQAQREALTGALETAKTVDANSNVSQTDVDAAVASLEAAAAPFESPSVGTYDPSAATDPNPGGSGGSDEPSAAQSLEKAQVMRAAGDDGKRPFVYDGASQARAVFTGVQVVLDGKAVDSAEYELKFYSDAACAVEVAGDKLVDAGTYWVKAIAKTGSTAYADETASALEIEIGKAASPAQVNPASLAMKAGASVTLTVNTDVAGVGAITQAAAASGSDAYVRVEVPEANGTAGLNGSVVVTALAATPAGKPAVVEIATAGDANHEPGALKAGFTVSASEAALGTLVDENTQVSADLAEMKDEKAVEDAVAVQLSVEPKTPEVIAKDSSDTGKKTKSAFDRYVEKKALVSTYDVTLSALDSAGRVANLTDNFGWLTLSFPVDLKENPKLDKAVAHITQIHGDGTTMEYTEKVIDGVVKVRVNKLSTFVVAIDTDETEYTVRFDSNGGSEVASQTVKSGGTASKPDDPTRAGVSFREWRLDGEAYQFDAPVTDDITLVASWSDGGKTMYRLYNPNSSEHFFTSDVEERDYLDSIGWDYEGEAWMAPEKSDTPVYRLYNENGGEHHYCTDIEERDWLIGIGWNDEGIGWYSDDAEGVPVYRVYNPNNFANNHHYTTDAGERDWLVGLGWNDEKIGWYGLA